MTKLAKPLTNNHLQIIKIIGTKTKSGYKVSPIVSIDLSCIPEDQSVDDFLKSIEYQEAINEAFRETLLLGKLAIEWHTDKK